MRMRISRLAKHHEYLMEKCVLVSYGERNKIISIPESKRESDLKYLSHKFKNVFSFGENVNLLITFQKFDRDWCEYLDLEENCCLSNKDKIKAVVTPILKDDTPLFLLWLVQIWVK